MKPELLSRLADAYEAAVEKQFKKLKYLVTRLDRQKKRPRPDFLVSRSGRPQMLCEVKTIFSAGYRRDKGFHISTLDENLAAFTLYRKDIRLTQIDDCLSDAVRQRTKGSGHCHGSAEAKKSHAKKNGADGGDDCEAAPDDVEACATVENRLREIDVVCRGKDLHQHLQRRRHTVDGRVATGEEIHWQRDHHKKQPKLRHRARHRAKQNSESRSGKQIDNGAEQKKRNRSGDRDLQQRPNHKPKR